jgi:hypothetical protein
MGSTGVIQTMPELARNAVLQAQQEEIACDYRKGLKLLDAATWIVQVGRGLNRERSGLRCMIELPWITNLNVPCSNLPPMQETLGASQNQASHRR